jgi:hypothetical protein
MYECDFSHILSMVGGKVWYAKAPFYARRDGSTNTRLPSSGVKLVQKCCYRRDRWALSLLAMRVATDRISHEALPASF